MKRSICVFNTNGVKESSKLKAVAAATLPKKGIWCPLGAVSSPIYMETAHPTTRARPLCREVSPCPWRNVWVMVRSVWNKCGKRRMTFWWVSFTEISMWYSVDEEIWARTLVCNRQCSIWLSQNRSVEPSFRKLVMMSLDLIAGLAVHLNCFEFHFYWSRQTSNILFVTVQ